MTSPSTDEVDPAGEFGAEAGEPHLLHHLEPPHQASPVHRFDDAVDRLFDHLRGHEPSDRILYALSELADFSLGWILLAWIRGLRSDDDAYEALRVTACLAAESVIINGVTKSLFRRERPVAAVTRPHRLRVPKTTSFPSGHASAAVVAALLLGEHSRAWPLYWGLAATVSLSRIHVQIHHASDVAGGAIAGLVLGSLARRAWPKRPPTR